MVNALLDGEDPKEFFRRLRQAKKNQQQPKPWTPPRVHVSDCHDWPEWEDLDGWQRIAMEEFQAIEGESALEDEGNRHLSVEQQGRSFTIYMDEDAARAIAIDHVEQMLDDEPELFTQDWLQSFINLDRLKELLMGDVEESNRSRYEDEWSDYESKRDGLIEQDKLEEEDFFDEDGNELEITPELERKIDDAFEDFITDVSEGELRDPMDYLEGIYGRQDAAKEAIRMVGIDTARAAEAAIGADGWEHFLAHYDGNSNELPSGAVYVRTN